MAASLLLSLLKNPAATGCVMPSSRYLATAMAQAAHGAELVVELGAGTGPVTQALIRQLPDVPLIAVEMQPRLAHLLRRNFPHLDVRQNTAKSVVDTLGRVPQRSVLVSSLPFRSLAPAVARETVESICTFLLANPLRKLVQFTYQPRAPFVAPAGLRWTRTTTVWRNAPPAGVWELQAA
ncbi:MAG: hypothetical protein V4562_06020 [Pseudomonadota bacterium]